MLISKVQNMPFANNQNGRHFELKKTVSNSLIKKDSFISFYGKRTKNLSEIIKQEERKERFKRLEVQTKELKEKLRTEQINQFVMPKITTILGNSSAFEKAGSEGRKKAISIGYNIRNNENESLYLLNNKEDILKYFTGNANSVAIELNINDYENAISVHNHPAPFNAPPSIMDINSMILMKLSETIITTPEKIYSLSRPKNTDFNKASLNLYTVNKNHIAKKEELKTKISNQEISDEQANKKLYEHLDNLWQDFAKITGWEYKSLKWDQNSKI